MWKLDHYLISTGNTDVERSVSPCVFSYRSNFCWMKSVKDQSVSQGCFNKHRERQTYNRTGRGTPFHSSFTARTPGQFIEQYIKKHLSSGFHIVCESVCVCMYAAVMVYSRCKGGLFRFDAYLFILSNVLHSGHDECVRVCAAPPWQSLEHVCKSMHVSLPQERKKHRQSIWTRQHPALLASSQQRALHNVSQCHHPTLNLIQTTSAKSRNTGGVQFVAASTQTSITGFHSVHPSVGRRKAYQITRALYFINQFFNKMFLIFD